MDAGLIGFMIYCAGLVGGIIFASWVVEIIDNYRNDWPSRVTARDIEDLKTLFETDNEPDIELYSRVVVK